MGVCVVTRDHMECLEQPAHVFKLRQPDQLIMDKGQRVMCLCCNTDGLTQSPFTYIEQASHSHS